MTHTTTHKKAPGTCDSKGLAADTTDADFPTAANEGKAFASLAASVDLASYTLSRSNVAEGASIYYAGRRSLSRSLPYLQPAANLLALIGGARE